MQAERARLDQLTQWPGQALSASTSEQNADAAVPFLLAASLLLWSHQQWNTNSRSLLLHCLRFAFHQKQHSEAASSSSSTSHAQEASNWEDRSDEEVWRHVLPFVKYFGLIHLLQSQLKGSDSQGQATSRSASLSH